MSDTRKTWTVIEVGPNLQTSTASRAFDVMRVSEHEEAVDAVIDKAASAIKVWRERCESLAAEAEALRVVSEDFRATVEAAFPTVSV
jgi:hypothetical protein